MICKLKERGTAFLRRLAIQFSKTEHIPSKREIALDSSPDRRGSREDFRSASRGAGYYHHRSSASRDKFERIRLESPLGARRLISRSTRLSRQVFAATTFASPFRLKGRCFYPFAGIPSSERQVFFCFNLAFRLVFLATGCFAFPTEGRCF